MSDQYLHNLARQATPERWESLLSPEEHRWMGDDGWDLYTEAKMLQARAALRQIIAVLGPINPGCSQCCDGAIVEMREALRLAEEGAS